VFGLLQRKFEPEVGQLEIEVVDLVLTSVLPCPCPIFPTYRVTTFAGSVGTCRTNSAVFIFLIFQSD
jgi:hypothetical protein